ncbi:MAG TPA: hypothetical protein DDZ80_23780 [Cyanobacteria bacterium UBA8803]|nr:hypothetical protein [Cyanobacteria bacterium UBA9273]HBL61339.1 hypothetical protein [Cyanobacteria bacterium UBA8803]
MKKLLLILVLISCAGFGYIYYYWRQATKLPDWYATQAVSTQKTLDADQKSEILSAKARLQGKIDESLAKAEGDSQPSTLNSKQPTREPINSIESTVQEISPSQNVEIELSDREVNNLVLNQLAEKIGSHQVVANAPNVHTSIKDGTIETGAVVNLSELSSNDLATKEKAALEKALATFPFMKDKEIYVGIAGKPIVEDGQLKLGDNPEIKVGNLNFSLAELSQQLNIPEEKLKQKLNLAVNLQKVAINDLELTDNKVVLRGSPRSSTSETPHR